MNIKSLLLGSAAVLVAVSGARAADAVVIPEPEAVEYVRVCDAAGAGYFYIPGGETCLKISGYVQYQISTKDDKKEGWNKATEGRLQIDSRTVSEYGAVKTTIRMTSGVDTYTVDRAHLSIGDLNMGLNGSFYDFDATGAAGEYAGGYSGNQISYTANFGADSFGIQFVSDEKYNYVPDVIAKLDYKAGDVALAAAVARDDAYNGYGARVTAEYAGFKAGVTYSSNDLSGSKYGDLNQWVISANYGFKAAEELDLNLGATYGFKDDKYGAANWVVGAEAKYKLTKTFVVSARARVFDDNKWDGRLRFKASF